VKKISPLLVVAASFVFVPLLGLSAFLFPICVMGQSAPASSNYLNFTATPVLTRCELGASRPCFQIKFGFTDADGKPALVALPKPADLASRIEVQVDGETVKPFFAALDSAPSSSNRKRVALILFDVSGSMRTADVAGHSRFEAAKTAIDQYLAEFEDGSDSVAIVPFASKNVVETIDNVPFVTTRAAAEGQLKAIPLPDPRNNTALYTATREAVERLKREQQKGGGKSEALLLVLTDGKNDVNAARGDDKGLLSGDAGLQEASGVVRASGVDVFPIGLGNKSSLDESALARLGTRPPFITFEAAELQRAFRMARSRRDSQVTAALQLPEGYGSRALLAGRTLHFRAKLTLADGNVLVENREAPWAAPPVATPIFEAELTDAEQRALLADVNAGHRSWWGLLRPFVVLLGFTALLCGLWFGLPRLIWPDRYDRQFSARPVRPEYWSHGPAEREGHVASKPPPPGFDGREGPNVPRRKTSDSTVVQVAPEFDPNKTRLS